MIKILHITGAMNRGGAEVMLMDLYRNIDKDIRFDFLINYNASAGIVEGDFDKEILEMGDTIRHIPSQWNIGPLKYLDWMKRVLSEIGCPDIVHIHMNSKSGVIAWAAKKAGVSRVVVHSHADLKFRGSVISRVLGRMELIVQRILINRYADFFWGCSLEANRSLFYASKINSAKCAVINNAVDVSAFEQTEEAQVKAMRATYGFEGSIVLGNVGRIVRHKNVLFIVDLLAQLLKDGGDFVFVFAGRSEQPEYLKEVFTKAEAYGIGERVIYLGLREDIPLIMKSFDVFVGPALKEGFGMVAVEAQAAGRPAILYKGFPKSVDMKLGLVTFVDNFDLEKWKIGVESIIGNERLPNQLIKERITEQGFDSRQNAQTIAKLYRGMLTNSDL